jgi:hypothetical protein
MLRFNYLTLVVVLIVLSLINLYFHFHSIGYDGNLKHTFEEIVWSLKTSGNDENAVWSLMNSVDDTLKILQERSFRSPIVPSNMNTVSDMKLKLWSTDFHISPIADIKSILHNSFSDTMANKYRNRNRNVSVSIIDKSLSGACNLMKTCAKDLHKLNYNNGQVLGTCPTKLRKQFYNYYRNDEEFESVDAVLCQHAASLAELYMPFNRTLIVIASCRYELGRGEEAYMYSSGIPESYNFLEERSSSQKEKFKNPGIHQEPFDNNPHVMQVNKHYASRWNTWNENLRRIAGENEFEQCISGVQSCLSSTQQDKTDRKHSFRESISKEEKRKICYDKCNNIRHNIVAANSLYDKYYMEYFTGLRNVLVLPSTALHVKGVSWKYMDIHKKQNKTVFAKPILLGPKHSVSNEVQKLLRDAVIKCRGKALFKNPSYDVDVDVDDDLIHHTTNDNNSNNENINSKYEQKNDDMKYKDETKTKVESRKSTNSKSTSIVGIVDISHMSREYPHRFEYSELSEHPGVILLPYQVSIMTFYEFYRIGVPIFVPSVDLLVEWHMKYRILSQRSFPLIWERPQKRSLIPGYYSKKNYSCKGKCRPIDNNIHNLFSHDPNNEFSKESVHAWVELSDYYIWPHVITFNSMDELVEILTPTDELFDNLAGISAAMKHFMYNLDGKLTSAWDFILDGVAKDKKNRAFKNSYPGTLNDALKDQYGRTLVNHDCYEEK